MKNVKVLNSENLKLKIIKYDKLPGMNRNIMRFSRDTILSNVELVGSYIKFCKNKPISRSNHTLTLHEGKLYLFGGVNSTIINDLWVLNLNSVQVLANWKRLISNEKFSGRYSHSCVVYKNSLFYFGGSNFLIL